MRAAVYHGAGDVRVEAVTGPGEPGPGEVLIAPSMAAICGTDASEYAHGPHMIPLHERHPGSGHVGPLIIGHEFVGRVEALGDGVEGLAVGDRVVSGAGRLLRRVRLVPGGADQPLRLLLHARAERAGRPRRPGHSARPRSASPVPDAVGDEGAAMAQPLAVAIHALDRGGVGPGQTVAVLGIGGIGALPGRRRRAPAASSGLIAVDVDPAKLALACGARRRRRRSTPAPRTSPRRSARRPAAIGADVVIEASGVPANPSIAIHATKRGGRVVIVGLQADPPPVDLFDAALREVDLTDHRRPHLRLQPARVARRPRRDRARRRSARRVVADRRASSTTRWRRWPRAAPAARSWSRWRRERRRTRIRLRSASPGSARWACRWPATSLRRRLPAHRLQPHAERCDAAARGRRDRRDARRRAGRATPRWW